jgi:hypothetical protein
MTLAEPARMSKLAALALVLASGCATDPIEETGSKPKQHMPASSSPTFTLFVSNQSLDRGLVDMQVSIDGQLAVSGEFNVFSGHDGEGCGGAPLPQHNWYEFKFALPAGAHQITVSSANANATLDTALTVNPHRFGVLDYWWDATTDETAYFNFLTTADEPGFL